MVLGGMWLKSLDDIILSFDKLIMKFRLDGKEYLFKRLPFNNLKMVDGKELNRDFEKHDSSAFD